MHTIQETLARQRHEMEESLAEAKNAIVAEQTRELAQLAINGEVQLGLDGFLALTLPGSSPKSKEYARVKKKCQDVAAILPGELIAVTLNTKDTFTTVVLGLKADLKEGITYEIQSTAEENYSVEACVPCSVATYDNKDASVHIARNPNDKPYTVSFLEANASGIKYDRNVIHGKSADTFVNKREPLIQDLQNLRVGEQVAALCSSGEGLFEYY